MTVLRLHPVRAGIRIDAIESISGRFAADMGAAVQKFTDSPNRWPWSAATVGSYLAEFSLAFPAIVRELPEEVRQNVVIHGLAALAVPMTWGTVEAVVLNGSSVPGRRMSIIQSIQHLNVLHCEDPDLLRPSLLMLRRGPTSLEPLYKVSVPFLLRYGDLIRQYDNQSGKLFAGVALKQATLQLLGPLIADAECRERLVCEGFEAFAAHPHLFDKMQNSGVRPNIAPIRTLLALHDPTKWTKKTVTLFGGSVNLEKLYEVSSVLYSDVVRYAEAIRSKPPRGVKGQTVRDSLSGAQRAIIAVLATMDNADAAGLKDRGFAYFAEDECKALVAIHLDDRFDTDMARHIKDIVDVLYPAAKKDKKDLIPYQISFENDFQTRPTYCNYGPVREIAARLYDDLVALLASQKAAIASKSYNGNTLYHNYTQLKAVFMLLRPHLDEQSLTGLRENGLQAFVLPNSRLQKVVLAFLQSAWRNGTVGTLTARTYRQSFLWFMAECGFTGVDAYPIATGRTEKHVRRLSTDDYYSAEQCRELSYHIEAMLADTAIAGESRVALMLARILLKTGWNLTPTLGIRCDDIVTVPQPLSPSGTVAVVLQKARAGYRGVAYTFDNPATTNMSAMRSAVADLLQIRDELTVDLRRSLPDSSPYKSYIFLVERKGVPQRLSMSGAKHVTQLLARRGCVMTFDTRKIRKGGVNHLYRQVQKDMRDYEAAAKHDFRTFESHYYRVDENQARYTLGKAVDVMGRYFTGKDIGSEIMIVTDPEAMFQKTPTGECASAGDDAEAVRYGVEHKRLLAERKSGVRFCADFLSCIWCKFFRLVADPEHVWKLLSYREYVLRSMESSVLDADATADQQTNIDVLKGRVSDMLTRLDAISPGVTSAGQSLLAERGIHPDWTFAVVGVPAIEKGQAW